MSVVVHEIADLSLPLRAAALVGFVVVMFAVAGLAVRIGTRRSNARNAREMAKDVGTGSARGSDVSHSEAWLAQATADDDTSGPRQPWQDAFLGPDRDLAHEPAPELVVPTPVPVQPAAAEPARAPEPPYAAPVAAAVPPLPPVTPVSDVPPVPASAPFVVAPGRQVTAPSTSDTGVGEPAGEDLQPQYRGKRAAPIEPDAPSAAPEVEPTRRGFLVDNYLETD